MLGGCLLDYCSANGNSYENNNSARGVWEEREREREGGREDRDHWLSPTWLPLQYNSLHVPFIIITCYLGLKTLTTRARVGLEPYILVRLCDWSQGR